MRLLFYSFIFLCIAVIANAQTPQRMVRFRTLGKDSINLALNDDYNLIEDSCSTIIRYAHYSPTNRVFFGKFKDVSKANPALVLSEGNYTPEGLKDGEFESHYPNGTLQSKGTYKNNVFDGKWQVNYPDGKPQMVFEANNGVIKLIDVWNAKGAKTIDNGKGNYQVNLGYISWVGKLENGRPEGTWKSYRTDDATQSTLSKESFKKGEFQKGENSISSYTDKSRIALVGTDLLPYVTAEKMMVSPTPCNGTPAKSQQRLVNAHYREGTFAYSEEIKNVVGPYLSKANLQGYNDQLLLEGMVSEKGLIYNLQYTNAFNEEIARGLINVLKRLPGLEPAMLNGVAVKEKVNFIFNFRLGSYSYQYRFLPLN